METKEKDITDNIIEKAQKIMQALDSVQVSGRANLNNLAGSMTLLEQVITEAINEIDRLQKKIETEKRETT